jgi:hypothetical protein
MTEAEWLTCQDTEPILELLLDGSKVSKRKVRLLCCAFCRSGWVWLDGKECHEVVVLSERVCRRAGIGGPPQGGGPCRRPHEARLDGHGGGLRAVGAGRHAYLRDVRVPLAH